MKVKVDLQLLKDSDACARGIRAFLGIHWGKEGVYEGEWDLQSQLGFVRSPLGRYLGWIAEKGMVHMLPMDGENFSDENLSGCDFRRASLVGANFRRSRLVSANFQRADLRGADFTGADVSRANMRDADLRGAIFSDTAQHKTNKTRAVL